VNPKGIRMAMYGSILGNAVLRREDPEILLGEARYFDDLRVEGLARLVFVRSTVAHAMVEGIDTGDAKTMPGVVAVFTAGDLALPDVQGFMMIPTVMNRPPLALDRVRFVGEIVAAVVAETFAQAVDAAERVIVEYDALPAVAVAEEALAEGAPLLFPEHGSNVALTMRAHEDDTVFDGADVVVAGTFLNQRLAGVPMESNGIVAVPGTPAGGITLWVPTQGPHAVRDAVAPVLGIDASLVRVVAPVVGGGFGSKAAVCVEHMIAAAAALKIGRPVKWTETRSENMVAMVQGRGQVQRVELGLKRDGTIVGLRGDIVGDGGAYPILGAVMMFMTRTMSSGVYRIPKIVIGGRAAATNTTPTAAYRGAGRPEAASLIERIIDMGAAELGIDPVEIRRRNFIPPDQFPFTTATGATYDIGDYARALDAALAAAGYDDLRAEQRARRARGDSTLMGIGVSCYVEITAPGILSEFAALAIDADGSVTVTVGTSAHGQGHETAFAMLVSNLLGVPMDSVRVVQADTAAMPTGSGTMGSRSLQIGGSAILEAGKVVLEKAKQLAAHLLEANPDDIVVGDGGLEVSGVPVSVLSWADLASAAADDASRPAGMAPGLEYEHDWVQEASSFPFGAHVAVVEVDSETGDVRLVRHIAVDDCGRILNPLLVAGQQHGGIAQGASQVLFEEVRWDGDGNPVTANLMDYKVPSAAELPSFEVSNTETPTPLNPLGAKGIGESGTTGATPAVQNAVVDALAHLGVRHIDMPATPERVWRAIEEARRARTTGEQQAR